MRGGSLRAAAFEVRDAVQAIQGELSVPAAGTVVVSGMLAEQLARELGAGAEAGAVVVGDRARLDRAALVVHVIAGEPTPDDDRLVRAADIAQAPVVLVQLWPKADWTQPFVLSPFVVECQAGKGFPVGEIASRIAAASEVRQDLAARIPALRDAVADRVLKEATVRAGLLGLAGGLFGATRPLLVLEQVRMLSRLASLRPGSPAADGAPVVAGIAGTALGAGLGLRGVARSARCVLPAPVANAVVAAAATWVLGTAARRLAEIHAASG